MSRKAVAIWSPPRSRSTTLLKSFQQNPAVYALHEPFNDTYYYSLERASDAYGDYAPRRNYSSQRARSVILQRRSRRTVFKEMTYIARPYITDPFLDRCVHVLLIRDPREVLLSLRRIRPSFDERHLGFMDLDWIWRRLVRRHRAPIIVESSELLARPEPVLRSLCHGVGVHFSARMLSWAPGPIRKWQPYERLAHERWHRRTEQSTGFVAPAPPPATPPRFSSREESWLRRAYEVYREVALHSEVCCGRR